MENLKGNPYKNLRGEKSPEIDKTTKKKVDDNPNVPGIKVGDSSLERGSAVETIRRKRRDLPELRKYDDLSSLAKDLGMPEDAVAELKVLKKWTELEAKHWPLSLRQTTRGPKLDLKGKNDLPATLVRLFLSKQKQQFGPACVLLSQCYSSTRIEALNTMLGALDAGRELGLDLRDNFLSKEQQELLQGCVFETAQWLASHSHSKLKTLITTCNGKEQRAVVARFLQEPLLHSVAIELLKVLTREEAQGAMKLAVGQAMKSSDPGTELMCLAKLCSQNGFPKKPDRFKASDLRRLIDDACERLLEKKKLSDIDRAKIGVAMSARDPNTDEPETIQRFDTVVALLHQGDTGNDQSIHQMLSQGAESERGQDPLVEVEPEPDSPEDSRN